MKKLLLINVFMLAGSVSAGEVCLGKNLSKVLTEHTKTSVQVNDLPPVYFVKPYVQPVQIASNLNEKEIHIVKVYFNGQVVKSWHLDFTKYIIDSVIIWRAPGSWRMEPSKCI